MKTRGYYESFWRELDREKEMIFLSGPRQAGKTTLARKLGREVGEGIYFNYDLPTDKVRLAKNPVFFEEIDRTGPEAPLVILDEIHKFKDWKNYLKGVYDGHADRFRFLVTGSGRLDLLTNEGDALAGRFLRFRMFPFTLGELFTERPRERGFEELLSPPGTVDGGQAEALDTLISCSGFPEPFLKGNERSYRRWAGAYHRQIVRDDIRDIMAVRSLSAVETLYALMPERVGSPLSIASLTGLVRASHKTVSGWLDVFERLYLMFKIRPYSTRVSRSLLREPKYYFYDWCQISDPGARFENLVAVELFRATMAWTDYGLGEFELFYLRTKDGMEVDFLVAQDHHPLFMVEVKCSDTHVSQGLRKMQDMLEIPAIQLVNRRGTNRVIRNGGHRILVLDACTWLSLLA